MDTVLYIAIAIAIMAYQAYSEGKKRQQKKMSVKPLVPKDSAEDELNRDLDIMSARVKEDDKPVPYKSIDMNQYKDLHMKGSPEPETAEHAYQYEGEYHGQTEETLEQGDLDIQEQLALQQEDSARPGFTVDPRLLIIYSEIAKPKYIE